MPGIVAVLAALLMMLSSTAYSANPDAIIIDGGDLVFLRGSGYGLVFQDGSTQYVAAGSVTSISTGAGLTGGPITGSGTISIANGGITSEMLASILLPIANGGTGAATAPAALSALGAVNKAGDTMTGNLTLPSLKLPATTATTGIIYSGANTLIHTYGTGNFFAGTNAGNLIMTGILNTAIGWSALSSNTTGGDNTATGSGSLYSNTTGNSNTANGLSALTNNTTASNNTALGFQALNYQSYDGGGTTAWSADNTAVGFQALYNNQPTTTINGIENTAVGSGSMFSNTNGYWNTAIGYQALNANSTGSGNTATGRQALHANSTGNDNTATGRGTLSLNTTGNSNTAIGRQALYSNTTASNNTALGFQALYNQSYNGGGTTAWSSDNTAVGFQALYNNQPTGDSGVIGLQNGSQNSPVATSCG